MINFIINVGDWFSYVFNIAQGVIFGLIIFSFLLFLFLFTINKVFKKKISVKKFLLLGIYFYPFLASFLIWEYTNLKKENIANRFVENPIITYKGETYSILSYNVKDFKESREIEAYLLDSIIVLDLKYSLEKDETLCEYIKIFLKEKLLEGESGLCIVDIKKNIVELKEGE